MRYGFGLPLGGLPDLPALREQLQTLDREGFDFVGLPGHVIGAERGMYPDRPEFAYAGPFPDPFVLFSNLAARTQRLRFRTSILILPALQTGVVASQAAALDWLSGGRFELGVAISWQEPEYVALGMNIHNRGRRMEEQIELIRRLWSEPAVTLHGKYHEFDRMGLNWPQPVNVPILMGSGVEEKVLRRVARLGDGWIPGAMPAPALVEAMTRLRSYVREAGKDVDAFSITARLVAGPEGPDGWIAAARELQAGGATELSIGTPPDVRGPQIMETVLKAKQTLAKELG